AFSLKSKSDARRELGIDKNEICILSTGGSLGARVLNENITKLLMWYQENNIKVTHIHSYGTYKGYADYIENLQEHGIEVKNNKRLIVKEYINMPLCMAACDLVITRCGASILAEVEAMGRGAILIPSPMVAENHQYHNGMVLEKAGAGIVIEEKDLGNDRVINEVKKLLENPEKLKEFSQNSAKLYIKDTNERIYGVLKAVCDKVR
ncbi:MAG: UDP-N-acetylglucosamine--N-acetylmuramyl-(pentapeptide) pyrophosphoryl-undecaprenol N-acetylglucosamine transferase, partial [Clostridiales bacterium]|nr:UDP-N-acetylglucosamine--N-acetylmuramyl-(pentapeptide) pyrophosphoryl-undecaprenol N-acetylglucosamine transferase [Clostridiales bacterium]